MPKDLALFDFDGTITKKDTLIEFIKFAVGKKRYYIGMFKLLPTLIAFKLKIVPNYIAKEKMISHFFKGTDELEFKKIATKYSLEQIDKIAYKDAIDRITWHKNRGDEVVIVSASMECWLKPWCEKNCINLICTKLKFEDSIYIGKFLTKNCHGIEKVNRIKEQYNLNEFNTIYAYGDSSGDKEMLEIANQAYFKKFNK